jgi:hypothetical protein
MFEGFVLYHSRLEPEGLGFSEIERDDHRSFILTLLSFSFGVKLFFSDEATFQAPAPLDVHATCWETKSGVIVKRVSG